MTFVDYVSRFSPQEWASAIETLTPEIHPIDVNATRVWFALVAGAPLSDRIETSHTFLYGHRHWPQVKRAILSAAKEDWPATLPELCARIADHATRTTQVDRDQMLGITAAALRALGEVGLEAFTATTGAVQLPAWSHVRSIRQVRRARQTRRPLRALLGKRRFRMTYSEAAKRASYRIADGNTVGSGLPYELRRCGEPCSGACVIGVLAGAQHLSTMDAKEALLLKSAGAVQVASSDGHPLIRLACHARPTGDVTFVI